MLPPSYLAKYMHLFSASEPQSGDFLPHNWKLLGFVWEAFLPCLQLFNVPSPTSAVLTSESIRRDDL
jgi:hypothetical protein